MLRRSAAALGAALWRFNPEPEPLVMHVAMQVELHLDNNEKSETYDLFIFASRDVQGDQSLDRTTFNLKLNTPTNIDKLLRVEPKLPERLNFWVYPTCEDKDGCASQTLLCSAWCDTKELQNAGILLELEDATHQKQGHLIIRLSEQTVAKIGWYLQPSPKSREARKPLDEESENKENATAGAFEHAFGQTHRDALPYTAGEASASLKVVSHERPTSPSVHPLAQKLIERTQKAYERYVNPQEGFFDAVDTQAGLLPAIGFVVLASQIKVVPHRAEMWLLHLHRITCGRLGINAQDVPQDLIGELICEMALWQVRAKLYVYDTVRSPNGGRISCDQWMRIGCFPDQALAGGDCEDFSVCILEFFRVWCGLRLVSPLLNELQRVLLRYTPCLVIGQLRTEKGFSSHAYVMLLDSKYLQHAHRSTLMQAKEAGLGMQRSLVLEGTCYTESTWRGLEAGNTGPLGTPNIALQLRMKREHKVYKTQCKLMEVPEFASNPDRFERIIKFRMPAAVVEKERKYGKVFSLLTSDFVLDKHSHGLASMHWMLSSQKSEDLGVPRIGVEHNLLAYYGTDIHLHAAVKLSEPQADALNVVLKDLPFSGFQQAPEYAQPANDARDARLVDRYDASPSRSVRCMLFDMRWCDWQHYESSIRRGFTQFVEALEPDLWSIEYQRVDVSKAIALMVISVTAQRIAR